jgi:uncharacterized protein (TIGR03435 family)
MGMNSDHRSQSRISRVLCLQARCSLLKITTAICICVTGFCAWAQASGSSSNGTPKLAYDVVSIKVNKSGGSAMNFSHRANEFTAENVSIEVLLMNAYDIRDGNIIKLPDWARSARYDVVAKVLSDNTDRPSSEQESVMMQQMLATRFGIRAHYEMRDGPVYDLLVGKGGIKMKAVTDDTLPGGVVRNRGMLQGEAMSMSSLATELSFVVERDVVDQTGLAGRYLVHLEWTPDTAVQPQDAGAGNSAPSLLTALEEQLGLKLVSGRGKVKVLVIDRVLKPEPN